MNSEQKTEFNQIQSKQKIDEMQKKIEELEYTIQNLNWSIEDANRRYQDIANSRWWRLTAPGRRLGTYVKNRYGHTVLLRVVKYLTRYGVASTCKKVRAVLTHTDVCATEDRPRTKAQQKIYLEKKLQQEFKEPPRARILLISHEMSLTGAPLVLLYMAEHIKRMGFQPVLLSAKDGPLTEEAVRHDIPVIIDETILLRDSDVLKIASNYSMVIANTIVCASVVYCLGGTDIPVVWWIHESRASYQYLPDPIFFPDQLPANIHIYSVCDYARSMLQMFRPKYKSDILNYYLPDYADYKAHQDFSLPEHGKRKVLTQIGTLEPRKGYHVLAAAIRLLPEAIREQCYFVLVAKEAYPEVNEEVRRLCAEFPDAVKHYQILSRDEIAHLHQQTDCLLCTSLDDPLPCVITEALSLGKPVISTENTGYASILREMNSGLVYENNDPVLLAKCIEEFICKPEVTQKVCANARATYERYFAWDVFARNMNHLMNRCLFRLSENEARQVEASGNSGYEAVCAFDQPKASVSVVIPVLNGGKELDELIVALKKQQGLEELEIVVVDSGSKDDTLQHCRSHGVKLIEIPNSEFSHSGARNMGAEEATGDILLFMTQDAKPDSDQWVAQLIAPLMNENVAAASPMEECPEEADLYYRILSSNHSYALQISQGDRLNIGMGSDEQSIRFKAALNDVSMAIISKVFMRFRYRRNYAEDLDMGVRLLRAGYAIKLMESVKVLHGHSRDASYYLKRNLVDSIVTADILHKPIVGTREGRAVASDIVCSYPVVQNLLYQAGELQVEDFQAYVQGIKKLAKTVETTRLDKYCKPNDIRYELADPLVEETIDKLRPFAQQRVEYNNLLTSCVHFLENIIARYVQTEYRWNSDSPEQLSICLYKHMIACISSQLACVGQTDPVYQIVKPLLRGV